MKPLEEIYKGGFFKGRHRLDWRKEYVCEGVRVAFNMVEGSSVIDVGCAIGEYVKYFREAFHFIAAGIEGSEAAIPFLVTDGIHILDLREKLPSFLPRFTVCISLEVAEHIEPEYAEQYVDNLVGLSDQILITAAKPGQGGHHHVNCQMPRYWEAKFFRRGFHRSHLREDMFKEILSPMSHRKELNVYRQNVMIFRK